MTTSIILQIYFKKLNAKNKINSSFTVVVLQAPSVQGMTKVEGESSVITQSAPINDPQDPLWYVAPGAKTIKGNLDFSGSFDFTNTVTGTAYTQSITATNSGQGATQITSIVFPTYADKFAISNTCQSQLLPGDSCQIQVTYSSTSELVGSTYLNVTAAGAASKVYKIQTNIQTQSPQINSIASLTASTHNLSLDPTPIGVTSTSKSVHLSADSASSAITLSSITNSENSFTTTTNCPIGTPIDATLGCDISVVFKNNIVGAYSDDLVISSDAANPELHVTLTGQATTPSLPAQSHLQLSEIRDTGMPSPLDILMLDSSNYAFQLATGFNADWGTYVVDYTVKVSNVGTDATPLVFDTSASPGTLTAILGSDLDTASLGLSDPSCGVSLAAGSSCWVRVQGVYTPGVYANIGKTTKLVINNAFAVNSLDSSLALLQSSTNQIDFGDVDVDASNTIPFLVYSNQSAITIDSLVVNDTNNSGYSITTNCPTVTGYVPQDGCYVYVTLTGSTAQNAPGFVVIHSNSANQSLIVNLTANIKPKTAVSGFGGLEVLSLIDPVLNTTYPVNFNGSAFTSTAVNQSTWTDNGTAYSQIYMPVLVKNTSSNTQTLVYGVNGNGDSLNIFEYNDQPLNGYASCHTAIAPNDSCLVTLSQTVTGPNNFTATGVITSDTGLSTTLFVPGIAAGPSDLVSYISSISSNINATDINSGSVLSSGHNLKVGDAITVVYTVKSSSTVGFKNIITGALTLDNLKTVTATVSGNTCAGVTVTNTTSCNISVTYTINSVDISDLQTDGVSPYYAYLQSTLYVGGKNVQNNNMYTAYSGLTAPVAPPAGIYVQPTQLTFADTAIGSTPVQTDSVSVLAVGSVKITSITYTGDADLETPIFQGPTFQLTSPEVLCNEYYNQTIQSGQSCTIWAFMHLNTAGIKNGSMTINYVDEEGVAQTPIVVPMHGTVLPEQTTTPASLNARVDFVNSCSECNGSSTTGSNLTYNVDLADAEMLVTGELGLFIESTDLIDVGSNIEITPFTSVDTSNLWWWNRNCFDENGTSNCVLVVHFADIASYFGQPFQVKIPVRVHGSGSAYETLTLNVMSSAKLKVYDIYDNNELLSSEGCPAACPLSGMNRGSTPVENISFEAITNITATVVSMDPGPAVNVSTDCPASLSGGASCTVSVSTVSNQAGERQGLLLIEGVTPSGGTISQTVGIDFISH